jgi:hypothetical protein
MWGHVPGIFEPDMKKPTKATGWIGDIVFLMILAVVVFVFFSHNGFIGSGGIQPYPY